MITCDHPEAPVVQRRLKNKTLVYGTQCLRCGHWEGIKSASLTPHEREEATQYDASIHQDYWKSEFAKREAARVIETNANTAAWFSEYSRYLKTEAWAVKRAKSLDRDKYVCQACRDARATHVHHLQYPPPELFGDEPLYWLVSVCSPCHDRIHDLKGRSMGF